MTSKVETGKKILIISQYYPPDITAAAFRISETAAILKDDGFSVKVLTAKPHRVKIDSDQIGEENDVVRVPIRSIESKTVKGYLTHYLSFMVYSFLWGLVKVRSDFDYVIVSSPPLFVAFSGWLLARIKRARFVLDIRDVWPDSAVGTGHLKKTSWMYRLAKFLERFIYRRADLITCVSQQMKEYIISQLKKKDISVLVLYNGLSAAFLDSNEINGDTQVLWAGELVISYIGNLGYAQNLDLLVDTAARFKNGDVKFTLIGEGAAKDALIQKVSANGLDNFTFKNACGKKKAFEYMSQSHALLIILNKKFDAFNLTIPSKVFDYLWANRPILYGIEGQGREILGSLPGNLYFDSTSPESLAKAAAELKDNYSLYSSQACGNRDFVLRNFTREKIVRALEQYLV